MKKNQGITLIALVITIIILLILAGVSIKCVVGDNGIINISGKSKTDYSIATEKETISKRVVSASAGSSEKMGEQLKPRSLKYSSDWHMIKVDGKIYSDGWYFVDSGLELPNYGKTKYKWLVNYDTGEVIRLKDDNYISLSVGDMLAVKDNLILNVDSSIIDESADGVSKEQLEEQLGEGVELMNFDFNEESGLTTTSFNFDGVDDYIKISYNETNQKKALEDQGLTFEFYGILSDGNSYFKNENKHHWYNGLFCYWNGDEAKQAEMRFGFGFDTKTTNKEVVVWNSSYSPYERALSDWYVPSAEWNIEYDVTNKFKSGDLLYFTITIDASNSYEAKDPSGKTGEFYHQRLYINGEKCFDGNYNKKQWDAFKSIDDELEYFCVGRSSMNNDYYWHYSKMNAYSLKLYSRGLTDDEVMANHNKTVEYHKKLEEFEN